MAFQDGLALKKPKKPPSTIDFVNNQSPRCFLVIRGLVPVFILKELPNWSNTNNPFPCLDWNQNFRHISATVHDPSVAYFKANCSFTVEYETNVLCGSIVEESAQCFFEGKTKLHLPQNLNLRDSARK